MHKSHVTAALALVCVGGLVTFSPATAAERHLSDYAADLIAACDTDHNGTLELKETLACARKHFHVVDKDHEGTIDKAEAGQAGITDDEFDAVDKDHEGKLDVKEYVEIVKMRFKALDFDKDGSLTKKELATPEGRALRALTR